MKKIIKKCKFEGGGARRLSFFPLALWKREQLCEQSELTTAGEGLLEVRKLIFVILNLFQDLKKEITKMYFPLPGEELRKSGATHVDMPVSIVPQKLCAKDGK